MPMVYGIEETADVTAVGGWVEISTRSVVWRIRPFVVTGLCLEMQRGTDPDGAEQVLGAFIYMMLWEVSGMRRIDLWRAVRFNPSRHTHELSADEALSEAEQMLGYITNTIDAASKPPSRQRKPRSKAQ